MTSSLVTVSVPTEYVRQQYSAVKAYLEDEYLGQGILCVAESELVWAVESTSTERQGVAINYPSLTMHGIVTHDPKYTEEHLVLVVQKPKEEEDDDENNGNHQENGDDNRSESPAEYDSIRTVNYRFVMATSEDLKTAYQIIAECQALHPDPLDDMVDEDEVGSDIDYGNEDENGNGNDEDDDPYGYNAHFSSINPVIRGSRFGGHRRGQHDDNPDADENDNQTEEME